MSMGTWLSPWWRSLASVVAGATLVLAFAPFTFWPAAVLAPAILFALIHGQRPARAFRLGWWFGLGQFGVGVSWVYESFTLFGGIVAPAAVLITALFVMGLAFYPAGAAWLTARVARERGRAAWMVAFVSSWVLVEMLRAWLFGGFPWLNLGISQVDGPLVGWLPLVGEYGVTALLLVMAVLLVRLAGVLWAYPRRMPKMAMPAIALAVIPVASLPLASVEWSRPAGEPLRVGLVQGNVPQMQKFDPEFFRRTIDIYRDLTGSLPPVDLVIWPETAVPRVLGDLPELRADLDEMAREGDFRMMTGTFSRDAAGRYYNALVGLPDGMGEYRKRHLVPFGEYFPLRGIIEKMPWLFEVPMSDLSAGRPEQAVLSLNGITLGASICFEADFSRDIRASLPEAHMLVTVSNDSWFGESFSPHQHLQMARARAIEFRRPMVRVTNTGISAMVDEQGRVRKSLPTGERGVLVESITPREGATPLTRYGAWPVMGVMGLLLLLLSVFLRGGRYRP
ncbi:MAG: apolipoprotein N-acyltransferase [Pseudomonadota bacterium]